MLVIVGYTLSLFLLLSFVSNTILFLFQDKRTWKCHLVPFECRSGYTKLLYTRLGIQDSFSSSVLNIEHIEHAIPWKYSPWRTQPLPVLCKTMGAFFVWLIIEKSMKVSDFSPQHTQYSEKGINMIKNGGQEIWFLFCWKAWKFKRLKYKTGRKSVLGV